jgi:hypothetical protein
MAREEGKAKGIEKFDCTNFGFWKMQIKDYLYGKKYICLFWGRNKPV